MKKKRQSGPYSPFGEAIRAAYHSNQEDEALDPLVAVNSSGQPVGRLEQGDSVIFYDIRGEREIELTESLVGEDFKHFPVKKGLDLNFVTMIEYCASLPVKVAFPPNDRIKNTLIEVVCRAGVKVVKISESEKAIHVGFFMNGKNEEIFPGEERISIPSPQGVSNYANTPEMSAAGVTRQVIAKLKDSSCRLCVANLANVDVVGHIENHDAVLKAVRAVDVQLGEIAKECQALEASLIVTSDHGTVEEWLYPDGTVNTGHTKNPVPFIFADFSSSEPCRWMLREHGELSDVAPTVLEWLGLQKPEEMTGESLFLNHTTSPVKKKILLLILDGWGLREEKHGNLIAAALTPNFKRLWQQFPHARLDASGEAVGMPSHTVGNSEAGHLHLGAGRRIFLDRVKIDRAIEDGSFFRNSAFYWAMEEAKKYRKALHLLGIVSHYSSHGTIHHLFALLRMAWKMGVQRVYIHSLIGRRGEKPESGVVYIQKIEDICRELSVGRVVTVMGRFWALDREENWDRVEKAYKALVMGSGKHVLIDS